MAATLMNARSGCSERAKVFGDLFGSNWDDANVSLCDRSYAYLLRTAPALERYHRAYRNSRSDYRLKGIVVFSTSTSFRPEY